MIEVSKLSTVYDVRRLKDANAEEVLALCWENTQFYKYAEADPTLKQVQSDMHITPPGIDASHKYYVGFYQGEELIAVMDLIDGYPRPEIAYIGFFMMNKKLQGRQIGTAIIRGVEDYLRTAGKKAIRLAIDNENPQSNHFWKKNGFAVIREVDRNGWTVLEAEKKLTV